MKAIFCHDNIYRTTAQGHVFSEGQFDANTWVRYLQVFDSLTVIGRNLPLTAEDNIVRFNRSEQEGVSFAFLPNLSSPVRLLNQRREARDRLASIITSADAVIVRGAGEIAHLAFHLACQLNKPIAAEVVGCTWDALWNYGTWQGKLYAPFNFLRTRRMIQQVPFAIYVSQEFLQCRYPCNGYTAVASNVQIERPSDSVLQCRLAHIDRERERIVIGTIASLKHRYKGLHVALRALSQVRNQLPSFEFRVLGNGDPTPWKVLAEQLGVSDVTWFCGTLPSGEPVLKWLDEVDIYIQPSFQEGVPRALIEAMSRGCPALGSKAGGIPELLNPVYLHPPGKVTRLAKQLIQLALEPKAQAKAAKSNFHIAQRYSADFLSERRYTFWNAFAQYARQYQTI